MGLLKVPLGVKDFRLLVKDGYLFADKSLLIRDLLNSGSASILFTRPRRFGKTLAISMLDRFFNIAYREEESEDDTFSGLRISECPEYPGWASEGGVKNSYPVIRLDMSAITFRDCESFTKRLTEYLMRMVDSKFGYLADSPVLRSTLDDCLFRDFDGSISDPAQILINICDVLTRHHGVKPVILLDEYDSPFNRAYGTSWFDDFIQYYGDLLRVSLKANENTSRVIMTGVQRIVVGGMFSSLNDFEHVGVNNRAYGEYFGITSDEMSSLVSDMARQRVPEEDSSKLDEIIAENFELAVKWFDGYRIGGKDIFNPWSSMNFINNHVCTTIPPRQYWNDTAEHRIMIRLFSEVDDSILNDVKVAYVSGKPIEVSQILDVTPL